MHCERHLTKFRSALWLDYIQNVEKTKFSTNTPLFLTKFLCSRVYKCIGDCFYEIDELPTEISIVQLPDAVHGREETILYNEKNTLDSEKSMCVNLPKPLLIKSDCLYKIRLKQTVPSRCVSGLMLRTEVEMESNVIVNFFEDAAKGKDNITSGMIASLDFNRIY